MAKKKKALSKKKKTKAVAKKAKSRETKSPVKAPPYKRPKKSGSQATLLLAVVVLVVVGVGAFLAWTPLMFERSTQILAQSDDANDSKEAAEFIDGLEGRDEFYRKLASHPEIEKRVRAARSLGAWALHSTLGNEAWQQATKGLRQLSDPKQEIEARVRHHAIVQHGHLAKESTGQARQQNVSHLLSVMNDQNRSRQARLLAVSGLEGVVDESIVPALLKELEEDSSKEVAALEALENGDDLQNERGDAWLRLHVVNSLGSILQDGSSSYVEAEGAEPLRDQLNSILVALMSAQENDPDRRIRGRCWELLNDPAMVAHQIVLSLCVQNLGHDNFGIRNQSLGVLERVSGVSPATDIVAGAPSNLAYWEGVASQYGS